jgi:hypothetical protein
VQVNVTQLVVKTAGMMVVFAIVSFFPAGTVAWPAGWTFVLLMLGFANAMSLWLIRFNPVLLAERLTGIGRPDKKPGIKHFSRSWPSPSSTGWL